MKQHHLFYIASFAMVIAVLDFPYGYYQLLRFIGFFAFGIAAYISYSSGQKIIPFVLGFMAIVFNPFIKVYLDREVWAVIDVLSGTGLSIWTFCFFKNK